MKRIAIVASVICLVALAFAGVGVAQNMAAPLQVAGTYAGVYHIPDNPHQYDSKIPQSEKLIHEQWTFSQDGTKVTGTAKTDKGDRPFTGTLQGTTVRGIVTDGAQRYIVYLTIDPSDGNMAGTIRMGS